MEQKKGYSVGVVRNLAVLGARDCCRLYADPKFRYPEPDEVGALIRLAGWSQTEVAIRAGVNVREGKGSTTVRRWKTPKENPDHRAIPYSAWRILLLHAGVVHVDEAAVMGYLAT